MTSSTLLALVRISGVSSSAAGQAVPGLDTEPGAEAAWALFGVCAYILDV